ncbi:mobile mystery protein B [Bradyrhizobium sp. DN5]|uniref:mobile mystery protein B n=1 Tax=unclassified Bradyrhizobium TaxID=2631580 RepID=UPI001FCD15DC|nr:mobile mystery protein B [Bradyrhizobium sp. Rc2d]
MPNSTAPTLVRLDWTNSFGPTSRQVLAAGHAAYGFVEAANLGVAPHLIEVSLHQVLDDARYWVENNTYPPDELAVRFHHRLVSVHPFPNGNGRWSRLAADVLIVQLGSQRFTWGAADLQTAGTARTAYIAALQAADNHDLGPLIAFARS